MSKIEARIELGWSWDNELDAEYGKAWLIINNGDASLDFRECPVICQDSPSRTAEWFVSVVKDAERIGIHDIFYNEGVEQFVEENKNARTNS